MARTAGTTKAETHERIVATAARAIRKDGYAGASVADVMKQAGLTHGGFYAHFASREAMLQQALERAATDSAARLATVAERTDPAHALEAIAASYLSDRHVEHPEAGCSLAALATETARQAPALRQVATRQVAAMARMIAGHLPGGEGEHNRDRALTAVSAMVGALILGRAVDDPALSRALRGAVARSVAAQAGPAPTSSRSGIDATHATARRSTVDGAVTGVEDGDDPAAVGHSSLERTGDAPAPATAARAVRRAGAGRVRRRGARR